MKKLERDTLVAKSSDSSIDSLCLKLFNTISRQKYILTAIIYFFIINADFQNIICGSLFASTGFLLLG